MISKLISIPFILVGAVQLLEIKSGDHNKVYSNLKDSVYSISDELENYVKLMIEDKVDYVVIDDLFGQNFTSCLYKEMKWVDKAKHEIFEDGTIISNDGFNGIDYKSRKSKIFLFKNFKPEDMEHIPCSVELSEWTRLMRPIMNKYMPPEFELDYIEAKYIHYFYQGVFVPHYDTIGDPYENAYF